MAASFPSSDDFSFPYHSGPSSDFNFSLHTHQHARNTFGSHSSPSRPSPMFNYGGSTSMAASTSPNVLTDVGNNAYTKLLDAYKQVQLEVKQVQMEAAFYKKEYVSLREAMMNNWSTMPAQAGRPQPSSAAPSTSLKLEIPSALILPDAEDYPEVPYWTVDQWDDHCRKRSDIGKTTDRLNFLTDEDGHPVSDERRAEITNRAKVLWNELQQQNLAPDTWKKRTHQAERYFNHTMMHTFPELGYAAGTWKVERFATVRYPEWCRTRRGQAKDVKPLKREPDERSPIRERKKRRKCSSTPPPNAIVITIDNVDDDPTKVTKANSPPQATANAATPITPTSAITITPTIAIAPITPTAAIASITPAAIIAPITPAAAITPIIAKQPEPTQLPPVPAQVTEMRPKSPEPTSHPYSSIDKEKSGASILEGATPPEIGSAGPRTVVVEGMAVVEGAVVVEGTAVVGETAAVKPMAEIGQPGNAMAAVAPNTSPPLESTPGVILPARRTLDPLMGLSIPSAAIEIPPPSESAVATSSNTKKAAGKPFKPKAGLNTARNLFAIDYMQEHPEMTAAAFSKLWKDLDKEMKKKYEALEKAKKQGAASKSKPTTDENVEEAAP